MDVGRESNEPDERVTHVTIRLVALRTARRSAVLVIAVLAGGGLLANARSGERRPVVRLLDRSPVKVAGRAFAVRERVSVRVTVVGLSRFSKRVRSGAAGAFTAVFPQRTIPECAGFVVTAVGARGSRATLRRIVIPPPCGSDPQP
jgi:hypothetical protein